ncbi:Acylphosphatase [Corynebacterium provencense]|uniref:acylphosphatase n=1 Tax=Corynebacterium provencense TaxID=1737425 RepID=A0A2Z3YQL3_9CORY|nr:Acylphosphatase [Corynebacterium provencense]
MTHPDHDAPYNGAPHPAGQAPAGQAAVRLTAWVHGHVQGVGFRWATRSTALSLGLVGFASNYPDGRVLVVAEGPADSTRALAAWLRGGSTPGRVDTVVDAVGRPRGGYHDFEIR